jgi:2-phospho-L-lactate guanylyltransferase
MTDKAWSVLIPVKVLAEAKSRLASLAGLTGPRRAELALALASDTVTAVLGSDAVARVIVITDDPAAAAALAALGALVVPDEPRAGLNPALRHGAGFAAPAGPGEGTARPSADTARPAPEQIGRALRAARPGRRPSWPTR